MLMIGTNNTARNTAAEIAEGIGAVVLELQRDFREAKILLLGVFPRGRADRSGPRYDRRDQPDDREAARWHARALPRHRRGVPRRRRQHSRTTS